MKDLLEGRAIQLAVICSDFIEENNDKKNITIKEIKNKVKKILGNNLPEDDYIIKENFEILGIEIFDKAKK